MAGDEYGSEVCMSLPEDVSVLSLSLYDREAKYQCSSPTGRHRSPAHIGWLLQIRNPVIILSDLHILDHFSDCVFAFARAILGEVVRWTSPRLYKLEQ